MGQGQGEVRTKRGWERGDGVNGVRVICFIVVPRVDLHASASIAQALDVRLHRGLRPKLVSKQVPWIIIAPGDRDRCMGVIGSRDQEANKEARHYALR